jgi:hypothetical protein
VDTSAVAAAFAWQDAETFDAAPGTCGIVNPAVDACPVAYVDLHPADVWEERIRSEDGWVTVSPDFGYAPPAARASTKKARRFALRGGEAVAFISPALSTEDAVPTADSGTERMRNLLRSVLMSIQNAGGEPSLQGPPDAC